VRKPESVGRDDPGAPSCEQPAASASTSQPSIHRETDRPELGPYRGKPESVGRDVPGAPTCEQSVASASTSQSPIHRETDRAEAGLYPASRAWTNAATAFSRSSLVWAAESWVRMRLFPSGTTG